MMTNSATNRRGGRRRSGSFSVPRRALESHLAMRTLLLAMMVLAAISASTVKGAVREVPYQYATIQAAINAAQTGDTVLVTPGTYVEQVDLLGKTLTLTSESGPELTVIDGSYQSGDVVRCVSGEPAATLITGFTIRRSGRGYSEFPGYQTRDAGINAYNSSPTIQHCIITDCNWGMSIHNSNSIVQHCQVFDSSGVNSSGIYCLQGGTPVVKNCLVTNTGNGGLQTSHCAATFLNNTVAYTGYPVFISWPSDPVVVKNNVVCFNTGWGIAVVNGASASLSHNDVYQNSRGNYYNCSAGPGSISLDPLFASGAFGSFFLSEIAAGQSQDSPCLKAGDADASVYGLDTFSTRTDLSPDQGMVNLGYHYNPTPWPTPRPSPTPTATPTVTVTPSPTPSMTPSPTNSPSPTVSPTPGPVPATGPIGAVTLLLAFSIGLLVRRRPA